MAVASLQAQLEGIAGRVEPFQPLPEEPEIPLALPDSLESLCECVKLAALDGLELLPIGLGSKLGWTRRPARVDFALSPRRYRGVLAYEPADGTLSARAGTTLAELRERVSTGGHWLTPDVPRPGACTLGGVLAAGQSGFDRLRHGPVRHHVLGMRVITSAGLVTKTGGALVKNVTGYDLHRLYCGSHGTLCLIVEASLRLFPLPETELAAVCTANELAEALALAQAVLALPVRARALLLEGAADRGWSLHVVLSGRAEPVRAEREMVEAALAAVRGRTQWIEGESAREHVSQGRDGELAAGRWSELYLSCAPSALASVIDGLLTACRERGLEPSLRVHPGLASIEARLWPAHEPGGISVEHARALDARSSALPARVQWRALPQALRASASEGLDPVPEHVPGFALMRTLRDTLDPTGVFARGRLNRSL